MSAAKLSISLPEDLHEWAQQRAQAENLTLSAYMARLIDFERQQQAAADALRWFEAEHGPVPAGEVECAERELDDALGSRGETAE